MLSLAFSFASRLSRWCCHGLWGSCCRSCMFHHSILYHAHRYISLTHFHFLPSGYCCCCYLHLRAALTTQTSMFIGATNFDQPRLYCNWRKHKVQTHVNLRIAFCDEEEFGGTCDLVNEDDCPTPPSPTPAPGPTANVGGGKTKHLVLGALFILCLFATTSFSTIHVLFHSFLFFVARPSFQNI